MAAEIIDGKRISKEILDELRERVRRGTERAGRPPCLAVVIAGRDAASQVYVRNKIRACERTGMESRHVELPETIGREELLERVAELNAEEAVDGILVQLPLPDALDAQGVAAEVATAIDPAKDVDGFHPWNLGNLLAGSRDVPVPCTPLGVTVLLERIGVSPRGKRVVIVGRSNIVGKPLAALLMRKGDGGDATVTVCHSRTADLPSVTRTAEILAAAIGRPRYITADMVAPGAVVIDVGVNRIEDPASPKGTRLVGDVDFDAVREKASWITPVPGGVGPMTIAMLMTNTVSAFERRTGIVQ